MLISLRNFPYHEIRFSLQKVIVDIKSQLNYLWTKFKYVARIVEYYCIGHKRGSSIEKQSDTYDDVN